jgi:hypothetical protein
MTPDNSAEKQTSSEVFPPDTQTRASDSVPVAEHAELQAKHDALQAEHAELTQQHAVLVDAVRHAGADSKAFITQCDREGVGMQTVIDHRGRVEKFLAKLVKIGRAV